VPALPPWCRRPDPVLPEAFVTPPEVDPDSPALELDKTPEPEVPDTQLVIAADCEPASTAKEMETESAGQPCRAWIPRVRSARSSSRAS
jgi:hypothetical protein